MQKHILNSFFIVTFLFFSGCGQHDNDNLVCKDNFIITCDNYDFFKKNYKNFLLCRHIALMRIDESKANYILNILSQSDSLAILSISHVCLDTFPEIITNFKNLKRLSIEYSMIKTSKK